ncbi:hypothetical protein [Mucisphaera sp.]|uniref:hypothetical protein n=1 Tax=Mucisphaera sp. TaxID=2913024 RepID=UPI003D12C905
MVLELVLVVHAGATCFMVGLIWLVQVVHYPLMDRVEGEGFAAFERDHQKLIGPIVAPVMLVEGVTAAALVWLLAGGGWSWVIACVGLGLVVVNGVSTALVQVPLHARLSRGFDARAHVALVSTNWVRTLAWSLRSVLALWLLVLV